MGLAGAAAAAGVAVSAGTAIAGATKQSGSVSGGENQALALEKSGSQQTALQNQGYVAAGNNALTDITDLSGANGSAAQTASAGLFQTDPGFQFDLTQGMKAQDNSAAARGLGTSGANIKGETGYAEGMADNAYGNFYNRLSGIAGLGQTAIGQDAGIAGQASSAAGQTAASAAQDQANITGSASSGVGTALNQFLNNATVQNALSTYSSPSLLNGGNTGWVTNGAANNALTIPSDGW
jgi:hypothetical protein